MADPADVKIDPKAQAGLTLLRRLVTSLLVVMIVGFIVLIVLLVTRFPSAVEPVTFDFPASISLPEGKTASAFTRGTDWIAVVTTDDEILIFDADSGELRQRISVD